MIKIALSCGLYVTKEAHWEGRPTPVCNDAYVSAVLNAGAAARLGSCNWLAARGGFSRW